jgi:hypothetical protein
MTIQLQEIVLPAHQYSINVQLDDLGFTLEDFKAINGKMLDIGCGSDANLVQYLRQNGIDAEGIDPLVEAGNEFLMKQLITSVHPVQGSIPRPDGFYRLIVSHMCMPLYIPLSDLGTEILDFMKARNYLIGDEQLEMDAKDISLRATFIILEALRTLDRNSGRLVIHPLANLLEQKAGSLIRGMGFDISQERTFLSEKYDPPSDGLPISLAQKYDHICEYRTVISPLN